MFAMGDSVLVIMDVNRSCSASRLDLLGDSEWTTVTWKYIKATNKGLPTVTHTFLFLATMLASRAAFGDSTNRWITRPLLSKSPATCTLSLTNATSIIPFPSSQPDPPSSLNSQSRRKRICHPILLPLSQTSDQPPRKRPRLHKSSKNKSKNTSTKCRDASSQITPDLPFLAVLQRSVACGVLDRLYVSDRSGLDSELLAQDRQLACRLRTYLLKKGYRDYDVVDVDGANEDVEMQMQVDDVDVCEPSPVDFVDMDVDVEPHEKRSSKSKSTRCAPYRSPSPSRASTSTAPTLSPPQLVASLILRHRSRLAVRSNALGSDRAGTEVFSKGRRTVSPLAKLDS